MKGNNFGTIAMGFFHAFSGQGRLESSLGSKLFPSSLSPSGFAISLLNTSHLFNLPPCPLLVGRFLTAFTSSSSAVVSQTVCILISCRGEDFGRT